MVATTHAIVGASIAARIPNPYIAIPLAIGSHFILDLIPHWDQGINWRKKSARRRWLESIFDVLAGILLVTVLFASRVDPLYLYGMMIAAQLPDWLETPYLFLGLKGAPWKYFYQVQSRLQWRSSLLVGIMTQLATILLALWWSM